MTSVILFLNDVFKVLLSPLPHITYYVNWLMFAAGAAFFIFWCIQLVKKFGGNEDKIYHSPTEGSNPYYQKELHSQENK
ncbi:MAG: hypothetical protein KBA33_08890 [Cloacibacterium sp.]|nr:hypothetical protein [Cloacibacterium sp.]